jgi:hypothetical protein
MNINKISKHNQFFIANILDKKLIANSWDFPFTTKNNIQHFTMPSSFIISLSNIFFQTYSKTNLTFLPVYCEKIPKTSLYDAHFLLFNVDTRVFHGYIDVTDVTTFSDDKAKFTSLLKEFNIPKTPDLYFIKFREITNFLDLRYTVEICNQLFNLDVSPSCPQLYDIDEIDTDDVETIINEIEFAQTMYKPSTNTKKYIYVKWSPCFELIQEMENNELTPEKCKHIMEHYNSCEHCMDKQFNTCEQIQTLKIPLTFTTYKDEPVIATKIMTAFNTNTIYEECGDEEIGLSDENPNIVYLSNCNKHYNYLFFIGY